MPVLLARSLARSSGFAENYSRMLLRFFTLLTESCSPQEAVDAKAAADEEARAEEKAKKERLAIEAKRSLAGAFRSGPAGGSGGKAGRRRGGTGAESGRFAFQSPSRGEGEGGAAAAGGAGSRGSRGSRRGRVVSQTIAPTPTKSSSSSTSSSSSSAAAAGTAGDSLLTLNRITGGAARRSGTGGPRHSRFSGIFVAGRAGGPAQPAGGTPGPSGAGAGAGAGEGGAPPPGAELAEEVAQADDATLARLRAQGQGADGRLHHTVDELMAARQSSALALGMRSQPGAGRKRVGGSRLGMKGAMAGSGAAVAQAVRVGSAAAAALRGPESHAAAVAVCETMGDLLSTGGLTVLLDDVKHRLARDEREYSDSRAEQDYFRLAAWCLSFSRARQAQGKKDAERQRSEWSASRKRIMQQAKARAALKGTEFDPKAPDGITRARLGALGPEPVVHSPALGGCSSVMDAFTLKRCSERTLEWLEQKKFDDLALSVSLLRQLLSTLSALRASEDDDSRAVGKAMVRMLFYEREVMEVVPRVMRNWEFGRFTSGFTLDLVSCMQMMLSMGEALARDGFLVQKKKRRRRGGAAAAGEDEDEDEEEVAQGMREQQQQKKKASNEIREEAFDYHGYLAQLVQPKAAQALLFVAQGYAELPTGELQAAADIMRRILRHPIPDQDPGAVESRLKAICDGSAVREYRSAAIDFDIRAAAVEPTQAKYYAAQQASDEAARQANAGA